MLLALRPSNRPARPQEVGEWAEDEVEQHNSDREPHVVGTRGGDRKQRESGERRKATAKTGAQEEHEAWLLFSCDSDDAEESAAEDVDGGGGQRFHADGVREAVAR